MYLIVTGIITNVQLIPTPPKMLSQTDVPTRAAPLPLQVFKRYLHGSQRMNQEQEDKVAMETVNVRIYGNQVRAFCLYFHALCL